MNVIELICIVPVQSSWIDCSSAETFSPHARPARTPRARRPVRERLAPAVFARILKLQIH